MRCSSRSWHLTAIQTEPVSICAIYNGVFSFPTTMLQSKNIYKCLNLWRAKPWKWGLSFYSHLYPCHFPKIPISWVSHYKQSWALYFSKVRVSKKRTSSGSFFLKIFISVAGLGGLTLTTTESWAGGVITGNQEMPAHVIRSSFKINWSVWSEGGETSHSPHPQCLMSYPPGANGSSFQNTA